MEYYQLSTQWILLQLKEEGLALRETDMVTVGTVAPEEAAELIEMSRGLLERRSADIDLQRTRSKAHLVDKPAAS